MSKSKLLERTGYFLFLVFFICLFFSFRAISSFALGSLLIWSLVAGGLRFKWNVATFFLLALLLYFIVGLISTLRLPGIDDKWEHVLRQAGLLLTGLAIFLSCQSKKLNPEIIFLLLSASLMLILLFCIITNAIEYSREGDSSVFFYHSLVNPAKQHAVYFSIYVFASLTWLIESVRRNNFLLNKNWFFVFIIFFSIALFFLSSKLVLGFYLLYLLFKLFQSTMQKNRTRFFVFLFIVILAGTSLSLFTRNPVSDRFRELFSAKTSILAKEEYDPGDYLNGVQFRVLQWTLVKEILIENSSWFGGVGAGRAQELLDKKYRERNMYIGEPVREDRGFLGYNAHNQFLESLLQYGVPGLLAFLFIAALILRMAWEKRKTGLAILFLLLFVYSLAESVFETQYGIILFSFLPIFLWFIEFEKVPSWLKTH